MFVLQPTFFSQQWTANLNLWYIVSSIWQLSDLSNSVPSTIKTALFLFWRTFFLSNERQIWTFDIFVSSIRKLSDLSSNRVPSMVQSALLWILFLCNFLLVWKRQISTLKFLDPPIWKLTILPSQPLLVVEAILQQTPRHSVCGAPSIAIQNLTLRIS